MHLTTVPGTILQYGIHHTDCDWFVVEFEWGDNNAISCRHTLEAYYQVIQNIIHNLS